LTPTTFEKKNSTLFQSHTGNEPPLPDNQSTTLLTPGALSNGPITGKLRKKPTTTGKKSPNKLMNPNASINTPKNVKPLTTITTPAAEESLLRDAIRAPTHIIPKQIVPRSFRRCEKNRNVLAGPMVNVMPIKNNN
jgi:hypothetical protein